MLGMDDRLDPAGFYRVQVSGVRSAVETAYHELRRQGRWAADRAPEPGESPPLEPGDWVTVVNLQPYRAWSARELFGQLYSLGAARGTVFLNIEPIGYAPVASSLLRIQSGISETAETAGATAAGASAILSSVGRGVASVGSAAQSLPGWTVAAIILVILAFVALAYALPVLKGAKGLIR